MTTFAFTELVNDPLAQIESAALGTDDSIQTEDVGKGVIMSSANNYVLCAAGDDIEGVITSVEPFTVNSGKSFGAVQRNRRALAEVGSTEVGTLAVGDLVVADTQAAAGTAGILQVQGGTPTLHNWRVIRIVSGTGVTGDTILLERV